MNSTSANDHNPKQTELTDRDVRLAAKEAAALVRTIGFGIAFPLVVATAANATEIGAVINCWGSCKGGVGT